MAADCERLDSAGDRLGPRVERPTGLSESRWDRLLAEARSIIWELGDSERSRRLIAYGDLATRLDMHVRSAVFFEALDALCIEESLVGGPMVTALVYNKQTKLPGQRFFILAERAQDAEWTT